MIDDDNGIDDGNNNNNDHLLTTRAPRKHAYIHSTHTSVHVRARVCVCATMNGTHILQRFSWHFA